MNNFRERVALVTGAGRGIGSAIARALATEGMRVFVTARSEEQLISVCERIREQGGAAEHIPADISSEDEVLTLFGQISSMAGRLDVCINNAGIGVYDRVEACKAEDLDRMYATNVRGSFLCCREALKMMIPARDGYIINISSVVGFKGYPNQAGYGATKHAVMGLTKSLAAEAQEHGVRVSAILPGGVDTEMVRKSRPDLNPEELLHPDDVAQSVLYLLSLSDRAAVDQIYLRRRFSTPF